MPDSVLRYGDGHLTTGAAEVPQMVRGCCQVTVGDVVACGLLVHAGRMVSGGVVKMMSGD